jgi:ADP-dependent NAD(P)H-hydrate dehydratase / NAD(P)H-hydrate epimerase
MDFLIPVLNSEQMRQADIDTMLHEPISSVELMERASRKLCNAIKTSIAGKQKVLSFLCGPGNNGGDGACIARMLLAEGYLCRVFFCDFGKAVSPENQINRNLLLAYQPRICTTINSIADLKLSENDIIVDCLFGTGLTQKLEGEFEALVNYINSAQKPILSVDMPSGLFADRPQNGGAYIRANKTFTIQSPKPSFFYAENEILFEVVNAEIKLPKSGDFFYLNPAEPWKSRLLNQLPQKSEFGHKGSSGHALLVGGNKGMHGAIALAASRCIEAGAGLTTVLSPSGSRLYMSRIPKAMHIPVALNSEKIENLDLNKFSVLATGPGLNTTENSYIFLRDLMALWNKPALFDADALNLIAAHTDLWSLVKPNSILTPHPGEFNRLFGTPENGESKIHTGRRIATEKQIYILAKDKYSMLFCPDGEVFANGSGGSWLSQGGSGDLLTGALAGWWARTHDQKTAGIAAMFTCGLK